MNKDLYDWRPGMVVSISRTPKGKEIAQAVISYVSTRFVYTDGSRFGRVTGGCEISWRGRREKRFIRPREAVGANTLATLASTVTDWQCRSCGMRFVPDFWVPSGRGGDDLVGRCIGCGFNATEPAPQNTDTVTITVEEYDRLRECEKYKQSHEGHNTVTMTAEEWQEAMDCKRVFEEMRKGEKLRLARLFDKGVPWSVWYEVDDGTGSSFAADPFTAITKARAKARGEG